MTFQKHPTRIITAAVAALLASAQVPAFAVITGAMERKWTETQRSGTDALDTNRYWLAEPLLKDAVIQAGSFGEKDLRLAKSMGELGRLYSIRGRFLDAEPYLEEELQIKRNALGDENEKVVPAMGAMAIFYLNYGTHSKADPLTEEILEIVVGKMRSAQTANTSGKVVFKKGQALEAWADEETTTARDPLIEWAITCDKVGNQYRNKKKYDMAERLYKAALETKETVLGKQHLSLANSYDNLGTLCVDREEYKEAEGYFRDALTQTQRILGAESPQSYQRLEKLAKCLGKEGKFGEAEQLYRDALDTYWKDEASAGNGEDARAWFSLGCLYRDEKKYGPASNAFARGLHLAEKSSGPYSANLIPYLENYAYVMYYLGRKGDTDYLRARANNINGGVVQ